MSGDGVSARLAVEQQNVGRPLGAIMIVKDILEVLASGDVDDSTGAAR